MLLSIKYFMLMLVAASILCRIASADEDTTEDENYLKGSGGNKNEDGDEEEDNLPKSISIDTTNEVDQTMDKLKSCNALYVYLEGCRYAYRLYDQGGEHDSQMGSYQAIYNFQLYDYEGFGVFPIRVAQIRAPNQLYFRKYNRNYWLYLYTEDRLKSTPMTSKASWFYLSPRQKMQVSKVSGGVREYYSFYANTNICTSNFLIGTDRTTYNGKLVYVRGCK